ncbi:MAG: hypothetical protein EHM58_11755 [Ignavibacteriae bacterium]|nr:MAG: hypothetical protein EHM58_11755 [Ignavibacteriota bacterium]
MKKIKIRRKSKLLCEITVEPEMIEKMASCGLPDEKIAEILDVSATQFAKTIRRNKELSEAIQNGRNKAYAEVHEALFRKATGFEKTEISYIKLKDKVIAQPIVKYHPPDLQSIISWKLHNRKQDKW